MKLNVQSLTAVAAGIVMMAASQTAEAGDKVVTSGTTVTTFNDLWSQDAEQPDGAPSVLNGVNGTTCASGCGANGGACGDVACGGVCRPGCNSCANNGGAFFMFENVIVAPHFSTNNAFSEEIEDINDTDTDVTIQTQFDWDLEYSPRFEFGYLNTEGMGWRARYWHFDNSTGITRNVNDFEGDIDIELFEDPDIGIDPNDDIFNVQHHLHLQTFDFEAMKRHRTCKNIITGTLGLRYAQMEQDYTAKWVDNSGRIDAVMNSVHDFHGAGPTFSIEGLHHIGGNNLGVFANLRGSLLFGESSHSAEDHGPANESDDVYYDTNDADFLSVWEAQVGLDYRRQVARCHEFFGRIALEAQYWPNAGSASQSVDDSSTVRPTETDMALLGLSVALGLDW